MRCQEPPPLHELRRLSVVRAAAARTKLVWQCAAYSKAFARGRGDVSLAT